MAGIRDIAKGAGVKTDVIVDIFEEIFRQIRRGETVKIAGFGSFVKKMFPGRTQTSPVINDGKPFKFPDSFRLAFSSSVQAKKRLNMKRKKKKAGKKVKKKASKNKGKK